eukprot:c11030_g1_i1 orf=104-1060(+)
MEALLSHPPFKSSSDLCCRSFSASPALFPRRLSLHKKALVYSVRKHRSTRSPAFSVRCSSSSQGPRSSSSSNAAGGWDDDDCKYLEAQVVDAVSLLPSHGHLFMTLSDGGEVEIDHVNPPKGPLLFRSRNPTIFLKIAAETDLILPIVVGDTAIDMLMNALHGEEKVVRPNQYHVMRDLVGSLDFEVRMVRVTERIADTYVARIYIGKPGEKEMQSVDARPSDAVNLAVRCKVPIYVHEDIVSSDAVRPVVIPLQATEMAMNGSAAHSLDLPKSGRDLVAEELTLVKNMLLAVVEERYFDAARWRDELNSFRSERLRR